MAVDRNDRRFFDFACSCNKESMEKWEKVYEEVRDSFRYFEGENPDRLFTTMVVFELDNMDNGTANIEHIHTDMWSGIAVKYEYYNKEDFCECDRDEDDCECSEWPYRDFWIECDRIHHGLARAYQLVKEFDGQVTRG